MRSSDNPIERFAPNEAKTSITQPTRICEDGTFADQVNARGKTGIAANSVFYGSLYYGTFGDNRSEERKLRITGGILVQLIEDSNDQLQDIQETIKRLQRQEERLQQRISNYEELKKLTED